MLATSCQYFSFTVAVCCDIRLISFGRFLTISPFCILCTAANEIPLSALLRVREQVTNLCISSLLSYRKFCATVSSSGQLILPEALKLLPLYTLGIFFFAYMLIPTYMNVRTNEFQLLPPFCTKCTSEKTVGSFSLNQITSVYFSMNYDPIRPQKMSLMSNTGLPNHFIWLEHSKGLLITLKAFLCWLIKYF